MKTIKSFIPIIIFCNLAIASTWSCATIATLKALTPANGDAAIVAGYYSANDYGGGSFFYSSSCALSPDSGIVFLPNNHTGRWLRIFSGPINAKYYGAKGDGNADDWNALNNAIAYCKNNGYKTLYLPIGNYKISNPLPVLNSSFSRISIVGEGTSNSTMISFPTMNSSQLILQTNGGAGNIEKCEIRNITFIGNGNSSGSGILIQGTCGVLIQNCDFVDLGCGVQFSNNASGYFTEYCVAENCSFRNCRNAVLYFRGAGNDSFHGSGLMHCRVDNIIPNQPVIQIGGPGDSTKRICVYNAPFDFQVWTGTDTGAIVNVKAGGGTIITTHGDITMETGSNPILSTGTSTIYHAGNILCWSPYRIGNTQLCNSIYTAIDGSVLTLTKGYNITSTLTNSNSLITFHGSGELGCLVSITLEAGWYDVRYLLLINHNGYGQNGYVTTIATPRQFDQLGRYGFPTFSVNSNGQLNIYNPNFSGASIVANIHVEPLGDRWSYFMGYVE